MSGNCLLPRPLVSSRDMFLCRQMQQQSQLASLEAMAKQNAEDAQRIRRERDEALREVQHLKKLLKKKEEECLTAEEELMKARKVGNFSLYGSYLPVAVMRHASRISVKVVAKFHVR